MKKILSLIGVLLLVPTLVLGAVYIISTQPISPDSPRTYFLAGNAYCLDGDYASALVNYEWAVSLDDEYQEALSNLALTYNKLRQYGSAVETLRKLTALAPGNAEYHYNLGINIAMTLQEDNDGTIEEVKEALAEFKAAESLSPGIDHAKENIAFLEDLVSQYDAKN